ncbi:hypothetical protein BJV77DRAFT_739912 [Russula vinacea]|nr:hypothetical protein BJV77DRAFT_739912 [Russula vinacea]
MAPVAGKPAESPHYKLYGVLYHHGKSAGSGQYTVDLLHQSGEADSREAWLRIDDEAVSRCDTRTCLEAMAMSRSVTGVLICCFIVALPLLRHCDLQYLTFRRQPPLVNFLLLRVTWISTIYSLA